MKYRDPLMVLAIAFLFALSPPSQAATSDEDASVAAEAELQAQLESEHEKALAQAQKERQRAESTMERAQEQLKLAAEERANSEEERTKARAAQAAEMAKMHEELNRARQQLRETSREIARVDREVARARAASSESSGYSYRTTARPVIGAVLRAADEDGYEVLGVSPDGPSERAGIQKGDVIVALGDTTIASSDEGGSTRLGTALKEVKADVPVVLTVKRDAKTLELTVVPEVREPLGWHTVTRFPTAPGSPDEVISIERIVVPEIDTEAMTEQIEQIRIEVAERGRLMSVRAPARHEGYEFEFHDMSELGDLALHEANVWFGLPMTQGLKLAEIVPGLGEYFKTDRGVLVLKAKTDNDLQLQSGDVILQVGDTEVNSPAEFMRTLREFKSGDELGINIKRDRKNKTLKTIMPDRSIGFFAPEITTSHTIHIDQHTE